MGIILVEIGTTGLQGMLDYCLGLSQLTTVGASGVVRDRGDVGGLVGTLVGGTSVVAYTQHVVSVRPVWFHLELR